MYLGMAVIVVLALIIVYWVLKQSNDANQVREDLFNDRIETFLEQIKKDANKV